MPLQLHKRIEGGGEIGIWQIIEPATFFTEKLDLFPAEEELLQSIKGKGRREQWLASRWLLHLLSNRQIRGACLKDPYGKPYLSNSPWHISLSHSGELVAVAAAPVPVGIDIQLIVPKISRIRRKFMSDEEENEALGAGSLLQMHMVWGAKESMYKAYGRKEVDFKQHMRVRWKNEENEIFRGTGYFDKPDYRATFLLRAEKLQAFVLVYALEEGAGISS